MTIFDGLFTGLVIGVIMSIPAVISNYVRPGANLPILVDVKTFWGGTISKDQILMWSLVNHWALSAIYGGVYVLLVTRNILTPGYFFPEGLAYALGFNLVIGLALYPIFGFGVYGKKEGAWVWLEMVVTHFFYAVLFYAAAHLFFL